MYLIWSMVYYFIDLIKFFINSNANVVDFFIRCIKSFVFTGSHYHFWFFPALFFSIIITTIAKYYKIHDKWLYFTALACYSLGCLGCSYYNIAVNIPVVSIIIQNSHFLFIRRVFLMAFPFFISGYWVFQEVYRSKKSIDQVSINIDESRRSTLVDIIISQSKSVFPGYILILILYLVEIYVVCSCAFQANVILTFMLLPLVISSFVLLLIKPLNSYVKLASNCHFLANFTYCSHPLFILIMTFLLRKFIGYELRYSTELFVWGVTSTFICGFIILKIREIEHCRKNA